MTPYIGKEKFPAWPLVSPINIPPSGGQMETVHLAYGVLFTFFLLFNPLSLVAKIIGIYLFYDTISPLPQTQQSSCFF